MILSTECKLHQETVDRTSLWHYANIMLTDYSHLNVDQSYGPLQKQSSHVLGRKQIKGKKLGSQYKGISDADFLS